jgi:argininosuccinate lyase
LTNARRVMALELDGKDMSQDPLARLRRNRTAEPRARREFPEPEYLRTVLAPMVERAERVLAPATLDMLRAHIVALAESRSIEPATAARALGALDVLPDDVAKAVRHPLSRVEAQVVEVAGADTFLGRSREETALAAMRAVLRDLTLDAAEGVIELREQLADVARAHLTTLLPATANGQSVQPTTLGHYLVAQIGPLARTCERLREAYQRLNRSPLGASAGMSTAVPLNRSRLAELAGFEGLIDNTFDAIAAGDVLAELAHVASLGAHEMSRFVNDLSYWARDDVGTMAPADEYLHAHNDLPQRRDPLVLDHLRSGLASIASAPATISALLNGRSMLGGEASVYSVFFAVHDTLASFGELVRLLAAVIGSAEVNRALLANRANRGFATSSELADLLTIDFKIPRSIAVAIVEQVVIQTMQAGGDATTLTPEIIDQVALRIHGSEIGIEPELLAKCLAPKQFVERRDATGAPAPRAVRASLEREQFSARRDRGWVEERRGANAAARVALLERSSAIAADPMAALQRGGPQRVGGDDTGDSIRKM